MFAAIMYLFKKYRLECRALPRGYYHFCTDGWKEGLLFNNDKQYAAGMTSIALMTLNFNLAIYGFVLMPNHVHIVLSGNGAECIKAFDLLTRRCSLMLRKDGNKHLPRNYGFKLVSIDSVESFKTHLLYLARNPYEKGLCSPGCYLWGSDYLIYNQFSDIIRGESMENMPKRELCKLLSCDIRHLPQDWEVHPKLGILPRNYVKIKKVGDLFSSPKEYYTRLVKDYESFVHISHSLEEDIVLSPHEINDIIYMESGKSFPGKLVKELTPTEKLRLASSIAHKYGIQAEQLSGPLRLNAKLINQAITSKDYNRNAATNKKPVNVGGEEL